jgi:3-hydroxymyristoyl/3-hydroxydecanoyl-(acyl carrier protein) dehydratase
MMTAETELAAYPPGHPAFDGHFPGNPIVPGVLLLDAAVHALCAAGDATEAAVRIEAVKFAGVVRPGEALVIDGVPADQGGGRFTVRQGMRTVASGSLAPVGGRTP